AAVRVRPDRLLIARDDDREHDDDDDGDRHRERERSRAGEDEDAHDLLGRVRRGRDVVRGEYRDALEDPDAFVDLALRGDAGTEEDPAQQIGQVAETTLGGEDLFARDEPSLAPDELLGPDDPHVPIARAASAGHAKLEE